MSDTTYRLCGFLASGQRVQRSHTHRTQLQATCKTHAVAVEAARISVSPCGLQALRSAAQAQVCVIARLEETGVHARNQIPRPGASRRGLTGAWWLAELRMYLSKQQIQAAPIYLPFMTDNAPFSASISRTLR